MWPQNSGVNVTIIIFVFVLYCIVSHYGVVAVCTSYVFENFRGVFVSLNHS